MRIAVLANADSWYYRDIARAAGDLRLECRRVDFTRLVGVAGRSRSEDREKKRTTPAPLAGEGGRRPDEGERTAAGFCDEVHFKDIPLTPGPSPTRGEGRNTNPPSPFPRQPSPFLLPPSTDVVLVRTMPPGTLEQVVYRMDALSRLEAGGMRVINSPKSLECAVDKYLTTARCQAAGLPVPETVVCESEETALAAFEWLGGDVVVKPLFGSEGRGILRVSDSDLALRTFRTLSRLGAVLYLQKFIPHPGYDVRILVLAGEVLGGMKRYAAPNEFRTNVSQQGRAEAHAPTSAECELAQTAAAATGAWFAGVDLLFDRAGECYVVEVNAVPGWKAFGRVNNMDVATALLKRIED